VQSTTTCYWRWHEKYLKIHLYRMWTATSNYSIKLLSSSFTSTSKWKVVEHAHHEIKARYVFSERPLSQSDEFLRNITSRWSCNNTKNIILTHAIASVADDFGTGGKWRHSSVSSPLSTDSDPTSRLGLGLKHTQQPSEHDTTGLSLHLPSRPPRWRLPLHTLAPILKPLLQLLSTICIDNTTDVF